MKPSEALREKMAEFKAAVHGLPCAACGTYTPPMKAHHVIYRQHLGVEDEWRPENAMPVHQGCHERHHSAFKRIPVSALSDENWDFAREVLGDAAEYYIERRYAA